MKNEKSKLNKESTFEVVAQKVLKLRAEKERGPQPKQYLTLTEARSVLGNDAS